MTLLVVGLIMGTRLWYQMWDAEEDDDGAFERRLDSVVREIGDRGKLILESVPPLRQQTPAPAPLQALPLPLSPPFCPVLPLFTTLQLGNYYDLVCLALNKYFSKTLVAG